MAVYQYKSLEVLLDKLRGMGGVFVDRTTLTLTHDEFIQAYIEPDHVSKLREANQLVGTMATGNGSGILTYVPMSAGEIQVYASYLSEPILMPAYCRDGMRPSAPPEIREKVMAWADQRYEFGCAMGDAYLGLRYLNGCCKNVAAMVALMPCLPAIMAHNTVDGEMMAKRAQKAAVTGRTPELPPLPRAMKERLREVSAVVNAITLMLNADTPTVEQGKVMLKAYVGYGRRENKPRVNPFTGIGLAAFV